MIYKRTCIICKKKFEEHYDKNDTCSRNCYNANYRNKHRNKLKLRQKHYNANAQAKKKSVREAARLVAKVKMSALALPEPPKFDIDKWNDKAYGVRLLLGEIEI